MTVGQATGPEEMKGLSPSGRLLKDTGVQNEHGDLNGTPDQPPGGGEKIKQRVLGSGDFQGTSVEHCIEEKNATYHLETKRIITDSYKIIP